MVLSAVKDPKMTDAVFDNPIWENARKALEAVSPKKAVSNNSASEDTKNTMAATQNDVDTSHEPVEVSAKDMYYNHYNNYRQQQMIQRPPFGGMMPGGPGFGMPGQYGPPRPPFGSPAAFPNGPEGGEHRGPPPHGFNPRFMPPGPRFQPRNNMHPHPGMGGVRFNLPKRKFQQNGAGMNSFNNSPTPNMLQKQRFTGPRGAWPPHMNKAQNPGEKPTPPKDTPPAGSTEEQQNVKNEGKEAAQSEWPPSLRQWVQRAFNSGKNAQEKDQIEQILKTVLTDAFTTGRAWNTDWDKQPLPLEKGFNYIPTEDNSQPKNKRSRWGDPQQGPNPSPQRWGEPQQGPNPPPEGMGSSPMMSFYDAPFSPRNMGMRGQRGAFQRGRGLPNFRGHGSMQRPVARDKRSYSRSRSRSRSFSRSYSRSWSRSRSRSRSRSPRWRRSPGRRSPPMRGRRRFRSRSYSRSRSRSRSPRDFYSLDNSRRGARNRGQNKNETRRGRGRGLNAQGRARNASGDKPGQNNKKQGKFGQKKVMSKAVAKKGGKKGAIAKFDVNSEESAEKLLSRAKRFEGLLDKKKPKTPKQRISMSTSVNHFADSDEDSNMDWSKYHIVGLCQDLEKQYLRLSGPPDAKQIRPVSVLQKSLEMVKTHWGKNMDYHYACEQMKTIRQDLTVQGVRDEFTVKVYETHARIAMEKGDHEEYNQCQTQLKNLYNEGLPGNRQEFTAYRILYYIYTNNLGDINSALTSLTKADHDEECIQHALQVRSAWALNNYHRFFKLYLNAPRMAGYLMDKFVGRVRKDALKAAIKAYRPSLGLDFLVPEIGFSDRSECVDFLKEMNITLTENESKIDCKASVTAVSAL